MRIAMMGSGGVGGYYGGRLAACGVDVTFIARGRHLDAIRKHGLKIASRDMDDAHVNLAQATEDPASRRFLHDVMRETVAVGRAKGVDLPADFADDRLVFADGLPFDMTSSMHHDLERGNPIEAAWLSGAVARFDDDLQVPTPVNRTVFAALKPHAASGP